jgi:hypothetical protein
MARSGPRKVSRYGEEFKATAVKLSSLPGVLIQDVAAALDIHPFMLSLWRKEVREGVIVAKSAKLDVQTTAEPFGRLAIGPARTAQFEQFTGVWIPHLFERSGQRETDQSCGR